jgi:hypothetical protein
MLSDLPVSLALPEGQKKCPTVQVPTSDPSPQLGQLCIKMGTLRPPLMGRVWAEGDSTEDSQRLPLARATTIQGACRELARPGTGQFLRETEAAWVTPSNLQKQG